VGNKPTGRKDKRTLSSRGSKDKSDQPSDGSSPMPNLSFEKIFNERVMTSVSPNRRQKDGD
jgi:hypothetical protein